MQLNNLQLFLGSIDLLTGIVAVCICVIMTILKKVLKEKLKTSISVYLPTVLAVRLTVITSLLQRTALAGQEFRVKTRKASALWLRQERA